MFIKFFPSTGKAVLVSEESDRVCSRNEGHDFNPENGARMGANGNECLHCGHFSGTEEFNSVADALVFGAFWRLISARRVEEFKSVEDALVASEAADEVRVVFQEVR